MLDEHMGPIKKYSILTVGGSRTCTGELCI